MRGELPGQSGIYQRVPVRGRAARRQGSTPAMVSVRRGGPGRGADLAKMAAARIGSIDRTGAARSGAAMRHAAEVWEAARRSVVARTALLDRITAGAGDRTAAFLGQVDLALVSTLGNHITGCPVCWARHNDGWRPADIITGRVRRGSAGGVLRATLAEAAARRRASGG